MDDFLNLLEISRSDINSSRILYNNSLHSQSYFYFQQASEKANKALWLLLGVYHKHELQRIGHNQFKPLRKSAFEMKTQIELLESIDDNLTFLSEHPVFKEIDLKDYRKEVESSVKFFDELHQYDLVNIDETELDEILDSLREMENIDFKLPLDFDKNFKALLLDQASWFEKFNSEGENQSKSIREILKDENEYQKFKKSCIDYCKIALELLYCQMCLMYCSFLTIRHSSATRYPNFKEETNPLDIYTDDLPIVKMQKAFLEHLEKAISKLIHISKNFEFKKGNETDNSVSKEKHKTNSPIPDKSWEVFGAKNKRDFIEKFLVEKNCQNSVPEQIQKELEYAEQLQEHSYYFYPMYGDAFSRLSRVFEMAIKARAKQLQIDTNNKSLNKLINLISENYPDNFVSELHWGRKMRNYNAHPEMTTMYGSILRLPLLRLTNTINDIFRERIFFDQNEEKLQKLKQDYIDFEEGLWKIDKYLVCSIRPLLVRGNITFWSLTPVQKKYPQSREEVFSQVPFYAFLKSQKKENGNFYGINHKGVALQIERTSNVKDFEVYQNFKEQYKNSPQEVKQMMGTILNQNMFSIIEGFKNEVNLFKETEN